MTISYQHQGLEPFAISVRLDGRQVGFIRRDDAGYYYVTKRGPRGESFPTVEACKASLEAA